MANVSKLLKQYEGLLSLYIEDNLDRKLIELSSENAPTPDSLVFISKPESVEKALKARVGCIVLPESHAHLLPKETPINALKSSNSRLAMALSAKEIFATDKLAEQFEGFKTNISMAAIVHPTVHVAEDVKIGPNVFIGKNVTIGSGTLIGTSAVIQSGSKLGKNCRIHEFALIAQNSVLGDDCEIHPHAAIGTEGFGYASTEKGEHFPIPHQGRVVLEDFVHVGPGTKIDRGTFGETRIGTHTKIDNLCHIAHNCIIGKSAVITAGFIVAGSTTIGDYFTTGGRSTITGHITIANNVNLAGHSVVHKSIKEAGSYYGYPLKPLKEGLKNNAAFGNLAKMKKNLAKVMKHLNIEG